ncbi:MAG: hypothetical protein IPM16_10465 [Chloroflexi bacterium]|nr:hypothetical protein [Chloroflexota bacterium]
METSGKHIHVPYFEIGPILKQSGDRVSAEVTGITAISRNMEITKAELARRFLLESDDGGLTKASPHTCFALRAINDSYVLLQSALGEVYDNEGRSYPLLRRCYWISSETFEQLSGYPTLLIRSELQGVAPLRQRTSRPSVPVEDAVLDVSEGLTKISEIAGRVFTERPVESITLFAKLVEKGYAQIIGTDDLQTRLDYIDTVYALFPPPYRKLLSFATSTTKPQSRHRTRLSFVDGGSVVAEYKIQLVPEAKLNTQPQGLNYVLWLDRKTNREEGGNLRTVVERLHLPSEDVSELERVGEFLDVIAEFADVQPRLESVVSDARLPVNAQEIGSSVRFKRFLSPQDRFKILRKEISAVYAGSSENSYGNSNPDLQLLSLLEGNRDLFRSEFGASIHNTVLEVLTGSLLEFSDPTTVTRRIEVIADLAISPSKSFVQQLILHLVERAVREQSVHVGMAHIVEMFSRSNILPRHMDEHTHRLLLDICMTTTDRAKALFAAMASAKLTVQEVARLSWLWRNNVAPSRPQKVLTNLVSGARSDVYTGGGDLLYESFEWMGKHYNWLIWVADLACQQSNFYIAGRDSIRLVFRGDPTTEPVANCWLDKLEKEPSLVRSLSVSALDAIYRVAAERRNVKLATTVVWVNYSNALQSTGLTFEHFSLGSPSLKSVRELIADFRTEKSEIVGTARALSLGTPQLPRMLFLKELLDAFGSEGTEIAGELLRLIPVLGGNVYFYAPILKTVVSYGDQRDFLPFFMPVLDTYLQTAVRFLANGDHRVIDGLSELADAIGRRDPDGLYSQFEDMLRSKCATEFRNLSLDAQHSVVQVLSRGRLSPDLVRIAESVYAWNWNQVSGNQSSENEENSRNRNRRRRFWGRST